MPDPHAADPSSPWSAAPPFRAVPEFVPIGCSPTSGTDDAIDGPVVLSELAEFVARHLTAVAAGRDVVVRAMSVVESIASEPGDHVDDHVAHGFLDHLSPDELRALGPWMGPSTRWLLERWDAGAV